MLIGGDEPADRPTVLVAMTAAHGAESEGARLFDLAHNLGRPLDVGTLGIALSATSMSTYREAFWLLVAYAIAGMLVFLRLQAPRPRVLAGGVEHA